MEAGSSEKECQLGPSVSPARWSIHHAARLTSPVCLPLSAAGGPTTSELKAVGETRITASSTPSSRYQPLPPPISRLLQPGTPRAAVFPGLGVRLTWVPQKPPASLLSQNRVRIQEYPRKGLSPLWEVLYDPDEWSCSHPTPSGHTDTSDRSVGYISLEPRTPLG